MTYACVSTECKASQLQLENDTLQQLQALDVDVTQYLVNQNSAPVAHEYRIVAQS